MAVSPKSFDSNNKWFYFYNLFKEMGGGKKEFIAASSPMMDFSDEDYAVKMAFPIDEDHGCRRSKRKKFRRGFSKVIKGAFFQASSTRKTRSKKAGEETTSPPSNDDDHSTKLQKTLKLKKPPPLNSSAAASSSGIKARFDGSSSSSSSLSTLSNSQPSSMSSSRSTSARKSSDFDEPNSNMMKNKSISLKKNFGGLYFLFISLVGLVFWGKVFAILCTATCLFLFNPKTHTSQ